MVIAPGVDHWYRYRPSSNRGYPMHQSAPTSGTQMMFPYSPVLHQGQQLPQALQQMSRPSPPQPTWTVPQTHNTYYQMSRGPAMGSREDSGYHLARTDISSSQSPALSGTTFSNSMNGPAPLATTDYFPGVIDTSKYEQPQHGLLEANTTRSMGPESL